MDNKNTLNSLLSFTEDQNTLSSFIVIYIMAWFAWHNQIVTHFMMAQGDFLSRVSTAYLAIEDNQYIVVFLLTCLLIVGRLGFSYLKYRAQEGEGISDRSFDNARDDQKFSKDSDITKLMDTLDKTQQQLAEAREREKNAIAEKTKAMKKILSLQHELDEAKADIAVLTQTKK